MIEDKTKQGPLVLPRIEGVEYDDEREELLRRTVVEFHDFELVLDRRNQARKARGESTLRFDPFTGQGKILRVLAEGGDVTQTALAETLGVRPQTLSRSLSKLEASGLVKRTADPNDKRALRVSLTMMGEYAKERLEERSRYADSMFVALSNEEMLEFLRLQAKLVANLNAELQSIENAGPYLFG